MTGETGEIRVSYSQLNKFRQCPQAWRYAFIERLDRPEDDVNIPSEFGQWWHALRAADNIERGREVGSLRHAPSTLRVGDRVTIPTDTTALVETVTQTAEEHWRRVSPAEQDETVSLLGDTIPARLAALDSRYRDRYDLSVEEPVAVEVGWGRELVPGVRLGGYVDLVLRDRSRNLTIVRDYKCSKSLDGRTVADELLDSQLSFYAWGIAPRVAEWGVPGIKATSYDMVRSIAPKTPVVTKTGTLSKSVTDYDLPTYLAWAAGPDGDGVPWGEPDEFYMSGPRKGQPKWGRYTTDPKVVQKLDMPSERNKWLRRTLDPMNVNLVRSHMRAAVETATLLRDTRDAAIARRESPRNFSFLCNWCEFASLCRAQLIGGPDGEYEPEDYGLARKRDR